MIYDWLKNIQLLLTYRKYTAKLTLGTQIVIIRWANAGILSAVLLVEVNRWFDVGPTPVAQQALHMKQFGTVYQMISVHLKKN